MPASLLEVSRHRDGADPTFLKPNMKHLTLITLILLGLAGGLWAYFNFKGGGGKDAVTFEFAAIERSRVEDFVSSTGTLSARTEVEVGTQVSGTIDKVLVDFNDTVKAGQLIALLDTQTLDTQVATAQADLARAEAQAEQATQDLERKKQIFEKKFLSEGEYLPFVTAKKTADAGVLGAKAALKRAETNRAYAEITSPINGIVIDRVVDPGQTVAASLSTPKLFTIAESLDTMEILANVDESDIGRIKSGQTVKFKVASYPENEFQGKVEQIRLMPTIVSNVVNYTVVVLTENPGGKLLPGMTATVDFRVAEADNALTVPASALTLRLTEEMRHTLDARREAYMASRQPKTPEAGAKPGGEPRRERGPRGGGPGGASSVSFVWQRDAQGQLQPYPVKMGVNNGLVTEIIPMPDSPLQEGQEVVSRINMPASETPAAPASGSGGGSRGGRGFGGPRLF